MSNPQKHGAMTLAELNAFVKQISCFSVVVAGAVEGWHEGAAEIAQAVKNGTMSPLAVANFSDDELAFILKNKPALSGVGVIYAVYMLSAALDSYLRGLCLTSFDGVGMKPPQNDDTWYSLDAVALYTGIQLHELPGYAEIKRLYDTRDVLNRLEFTLEWSPDYIESLPNAVVNFAVEVQTLFDKIKDFGPAGRRKKIIWPEEPDSAV